MDNREGDSHHEVRIGEDRVVGADEGYKIVSSHIRSGDIVLMGDIHDKTDQHALFGGYMRRIVEEGIDFSVALELPHQITELVPELTAEEILNYANYYYAISGYEELGEIFSAGILPILQLAKDKDIPVLCVDDLREKKRTYYTGQAVDFSNTADNNYRDEFMATQLRQAKRLSGKPILGMLGNNHTRLGAVPSLVNAFSVHMGEVDYTHKAFPRGSFDLQIKTDPLL